MSFTGSSGREERVVRAETVFVVVCCRRYYYYVLLSVLLVGVLVAAALFLGVLVFLFLAIAEYLELLFQTSAERLVESC